MRLAILSRALLSLPMASTIELTERPWDTAGDDRLGDDAVASSCCASHCIVNTNFAKSKYSPREMTPSPSASKIWQKCWQEANVMCQPFPPQSRTSNGGNSAGDSDPLRFASRPSNSAIAPSTNCGDANKSCIQGGMRCRICSRARLSLAMVRTTDALDWLGLAPTTGTSSCGNLGSAPARSETVIINLTSSMCSALVITPFRSASKISSILWHCDTLTVHVWTPASLTSMGQISCAVKYPRR
mmetsp:Transcript_45165/g.96442  ORF Transcript_45165/g.96442 Transcript_45165/m.96442 type:complete len:243 (-) Transcript_45165:23-751(-)